MRSDSRPVVAGIPISHADRIVYPDLGLTKLDVARYYEAVGDWILPQVKGRPLTLVHCPAGLAQPCRYMRHTKVWGPAALRRVKIQEQTKVGEYLVADSIQAVIALAQMSVLEMHTWNSTADRVEYPNRIVWGPGPGAGRSMAGGRRRRPPSAVGAAGAAAGIVGQDHGRQRPARRRTARSGARLV